MARRRTPSREIDDAQTAIYEGRPHRDTKRGYERAPEAEKAIRVISMKTPGVPAPKPIEDAKRAAKLRALSEISAPSINLPLGNLAPPRDEDESARRHHRGNAMIALAVLAIGVVVMLAVYLFAR